jgi:hypothetical protein
LDWKNGRIPYSRKITKSNFTKSNKKGYYRFCENKNVRPEQILQPHIDTSIQRCREQPLVLVPQDTTELDFSRPNSEVAGAGPLDGSSRRGAFLHTNQAYTFDGTPLGILDFKLWAREIPEIEITPAEKRKQRLAAPFEQRESYRWLEGLRSVQKIAEQCPETQFVSLNDSEGDIYELLCEKITCPNFNWIIRACKERVVLDEEKEMIGYLPLSLQSHPLLYTYSIHVRERDAKVSCETRKRRSSRSERMAEVSVRAGRVVIQKPQSKRDLPASVPVNVVWVREECPPRGEEPIEWILLTTLPITTEEQARLVIEYYTVRWMIEVYHRTLKSGCRIEERRFETLPRMLNCLAIYMIVAWRVLYVCRLGHSCPDFPCDVVFSESEWQSVYVLLHPKEVLPKEPPRLLDFVRMVGRLGGFVYHPKRGDSPGVETLWIGLMRVRDFAWAWDTFRNSPETCVV